MIPLTALLLLVGTVTCIVIHNTLELSADRVLVGSTRTLSLALDAPETVRNEVVDLAVHLLQRRARPVPYYSIYEGQKLVSGYSDLRPPADYRPPYTDYVDRHAPATFPVSYRDRKLHRGYVDLEQGKSVLQPAYLTFGMFRGQPARIAVEVRQVQGFSVPLVIQVADHVTDRHDYQKTRYLQVIGGGILILLISVLLFWWAVTWGLAPFSLLHGQVLAATANPPEHFRLALPTDTPKEAVPFIRSFNTMMDRTQRATEGVRQFTANASHQMRTPLSILRVHLDVLERFGASSPQGEAALRDIEGAVDTLERLLMQLIALERASQQPIDPEQAFDLSEAAASAARSRYVQALEDDIEIAFENGSNTPLMARGNEILATELIGNLIDNAIRYNRPGGFVTIRLCRIDGLLRLEVEDDGPGIPPGEREKVFERFYRRASTADRPGSGLGLPIVRTLADRMNATVSLSEGENARGLCVTVDFREAA